MASAAMAKADSPRIGTVDGVVAFAQSNEGGKDERQGQPFRPLPAPARGACSVHGHAVDRLRRGKTDADTRRQHQRMRWTRARSAASAGSRRHKPAHTLKYVRACPLAVSTIACSAS